MPIVLQGTEIFKETHRTNACQNFITQIIISSPVLNFSYVRLGSRIMNRNCIHPCIVFICPGDYIIPSIFKTFSCPIWKASQNHLLLLSIFFALMSFFLTVLLFSSFSLFLSSVSFFFPLFLPFIPPLLKSFPICVGIWNFIQTCLSKNLFAPEL